MRIIYYIILIILIIYFILILKYQNRINNDYTIQQVHNPNYSIVENIINSRSPSIITGWLENISELRKWSFDYFERLNPDYIVSIKKNIPEQEKTKLLQMTIKEYIDFIRKNTYKGNYYLSEDIHYLSSNTIDSEINDFFSKYFMNIGHIKTNALWIGPNQSKTGLHYDKDHINLLCQVKGEKKIVLFSPLQTPYLYQSDKYDNGAILSHINFWNPDLKKYPLFNQAKYVEIILHEGQILIIPPFWWHAIENIGDNIAFSYRSESIFSIVSKLPDTFKIVLHKCGLYKNNNCVCCSEDISKYA